MTSASKGAPDRLGDRSAAARQPVDDAERRRRSRGPRSRIRSIAATVEPPVVTVSSTTRHLVAGLDRALDPALQAVLLALLADEEADQALAAGTAIAAQASGIAAITGPPTARRPPRRGVGDQLAGGAEAGAGAAAPGGRRRSTAASRPLDERHPPDHQRVLAQLARAASARAASRSAKAR